MEQNNISTGAKAQNTKTHSGWKVAAIVLAVILVGTIGAVTIFAVKSNDEKSDLKNTISSLKNIKNEERPETVPEQMPNTEPDNTRYLTIKEWGVKFQVPEGIDEISYEYVNDKYIYFKGTLKDAPGTSFFEIGKNVHSFGYNDTDNGLVGGGYTGVIFRTNVEGEKQDRCTGLTCSAVLGDHNGYSYYFSTHLEN